MSSFTTLWNTRAGVKLGTASQKAAAVAQDIATEIRTVDSMSDEIKAEYDTLVAGYVTVGNADVVASAMAGLKLAEMIEAEVAKAGK